MNADPNRKSEVPLLADAIAETYRQIYPHMSEDSYRQLREFIYNPPEKTHEKEGRAFSIGKAIVYSDLLNRKAKEKPLEVEFSLSPELRKLSQEAAMAIGKTTGAKGKAIRSAPAEADAIKIQLGMINQTSVTADAIRSFTNWLEMATNPEKISARRHY